MDIFQILALGIVAVAMIITVKQQRPEFALVIAILAGIVILISVISKLKTVVDVISNFTEAGGIKGENIVLVVKIVGIAYVTEFACGICKDAGESSVAAKMELAGKISMLTLAIPIVVSLFKTLTEIMV